MIKKIFNKLSSLKYTNSELRFIEHNRRIFPPASVSPNAPIVLMELNSMQSAHIAYAYLANVLASRFQARIVAYSFEEQSWRAKFLFPVYRMLGLNVGPYGIYRSFGAVELMRVSPSPAQKMRARELFEDLTRKIKTKTDLESLVIDGVWVGDLIYDSYLRNKSQPTVDIQSAGFRKYLLFMLEQFVFWREYIDGFNVAGVNVSHCVYNLAIPMRLAVWRGIPAFQVNATHAYRLSKENVFAYNDFFYFRERFLQLPDSTREQGLKLAKERIDLRFSGAVGVDMAYSTKSAYGEIKKVRLLRESSRKKVLIATHCFFDSPHSYGKNIFPDFYEWLDFLGMITEQTDYDWYIKTHPDYLPGTKEIVDGFIARYPKFTLLPADASHHQIIAEGIDVALTTYGTIGFEYAALGIPVINASQNNPHAAYGFNVHAKDVEDYRRLLLDLEHLQIDIDKQQIYEYYFMRHIFNTENIFFQDYGAVISELGGYKNQFTPNVYNKWLEEFSITRHDQILKAIKKFIDSDNFRMDYSHYGKEFTLETKSIQA